MSEFHWTVFNARANSTFHLPRRFARAVKSSWFNNFAVIGRTVSTCTGLLSQPYNTTCGKAPNGPLALRSGRSSMRKRPTSVLWLGRLPCRSNIASFNPCANCRQRFVADGAGAGGEFVYDDCAAENLHPVADFHAIRDCGGVHLRQIH